MMIWLIAVVLVGLMAWMGYLTGTVQSLVNLAGLILAACLALPLGPLIQPLFPKVGVTSTFLNWVLPPLTVFVLLLGVFGVVGYFVHRKVYLHYKYKTDDVERLRWERLNQRGGLSIGIVVGCVWLVIVGVVVNAAGYFTVQVSDETSPLPMRFLTSARKDLETSGFARTMAKFDPTPPRLYEVVDILGLVYHNPLLYGRLAGYPELLKFGERTEFQEIAKDTEFNQMLQAQDPIINIFQNQRVQAILKNTELLKELAAVDLADLQQYLETGVSPKYEFERILGPWHVSVNATLAELRRGMTNLPSGMSWVTVRKTVTPVLMGMSLVFTPEKRVFVKVEPKAMPGSTTSAPTTTAAPDQPTEAPQPGRAPTARNLTARIMPQAQQPSPYQQRYAPVNQQYYQQRYGIQPQIAPAPVPQAAPPPRPAAPQHPLAKLASVQGSWKRTDDGYQVSLSGSGAMQALQATVRNEILILSGGPVTIVCRRG